MLLYIKSTVPLATSESGNVGQFSVAPASAAAAGVSSAEVSSADGAPTETGTESSCATTPGKPSRSTAAIWLVMAGVMLSRRRREGRPRQRP